MLSRFLENIIDATTQTGGLQDEINGISENSAFRIFFENALVALARVADVAVFLGKSIALVGQAFSAAAADAQLAVAALNKAQVWNWFSDEASSELDAALENRNKTVEKFNAQLEDIFSYQGNMFEKAALDALKPTTAIGKGMEIVLVDLTKVAKDAKGATDELTGSIGNTAKVVDEFVRQRQRDTESAWANISAIQDQAIALEDQNEVYGMSQDAIEQLAVARLQDQIAILEGFDGSEKQIELIEAEIEARQRLIAAMQGRDRLEAQAEARRAAEAAAKETEKEWARTAERIEQDLTDALMRGFESGAGS